MLHLIDYGTPILYLPKAPDGPNRELNGQSSGRNKDKWGLQAERINKRRPKE